MIEHMLADKSGSDPDFPVCGAALLQPIGAHASGRIGETRAASEQSLPVHRAGRRRQASAAARLGRRLRHHGRHRRARLHPRHGPRAAANLAALDYLEKKRRSIT